MLDQETKIVQMVKSRRLIAEALKVLLSKQKWHELIERSRFLAIDPEEEIDDIDEPVPFAENEEKDAGINFAAVSVDGCVVESIPSVSSAGMRIDRQALDNTQNTRLAM